MAAYLLNCECGNTVPVEIGQAGGQIICRCGAKLDVPPLRQLRHLPQAQVAEAVTSRSWGTRQGVITASLIIVAALLGWSAWNWWHEPVVPKFVATDYLVMVDKHLEEMKPADAWNRWIEYYRLLPNHGLPVFQAGNLAQIQETIAHKRFLRGMLLTIAGIFAVTALATAFWPKPTSLAAPRREARRP